MIVKYLKAREAPHLAGGFASRWPAGPMAGGTSERGSAFHLAGNGARAAGRAAERNQSNGLKPKKSSG